ncbi:MAG: DUF488 domain-containing protein [Candidatus Delongbacteria bacterium]|nr:DUF488 domain-containing protein [Candidatus Delongbacteria bacterium]
MRSKTIYTIGHSTHEINIFVELLIKNHINAILDVRSIPYSKYADQFNKDDLRNKLKSNNIKYIYIGDQLGARYTEKNLQFSNGKVNFSEVVKLNNFINGIERIKDGLEKGYSIALMCSEKNPLECHRFSMISNYLNKNNFEVLHILPERTISHKDLEKMLYNYFITKGKLTFDLDRIFKIEDVQCNLFNNQTIDDMYLELNKLVGYDSNTEKDINDDN